MSLDAVIPDEMEIELQAAEPTGTESLRSRAIRSSAWTMFSYGGNTILRLGGNLVLTRLLTPQLFGLSALINIFIQGLHMFSDVGVAPSIIQNPHGDEPEFLNTAWTIQSSRGIVIWICSAIIAWPVSKFYGIHQLVYLIPIA
ncbi:MAG TPA: oligosaccharide flippase family protein, partial [Tepidisphaeraceae bacterium]|nr:oligosaccharide flippase family protein [Tepidisphaeraceae bacterium]